MPVYTRLASSRVKLSVGFCWPRYLQNHISSVHSYVMAAPIESRKPAEGAMHCCHSADNTTLSM